MNCEKFLELISGHIDESNTPEEEARLQAHLASCASCRAILSAYEELDQGLSALKAEPPAELARNIMESIRQETPAPRKVRRFPARGIAATAVAAALLLVVGITYLPSLDRGTEDAAAVPDTVAYVADLPSGDASAFAKSLPAETETENASVPETASADVPETTSADAPETAVAPQTKITSQSATETTAPLPTESEAADDSVISASSGSTGNTTTPDTLTVVPSIMTAEVPSDAVQEAFPDGQALPQLLVELVDNPDAPAAANIVELAQLTAKATATDRIVFYECSAATLRQIVASYETVYEFETPDQLDTAADTDACGLLVIQP